MQNNRVKTVGEIMSDTNRSAGKGIAMLLGGFLLAVGLIYTGIHNYNLFVKALPDDQKMFAIIPVLLLEGSIAVFMIGSYAWFWPGMQKMSASAFGWILFLIVAANTIVDSITQKAGPNDMPSWLQVYAGVLLYGVPVAVLAMWKFVFDQDPSKKNSDHKKSVDAAVEMAKYNATMIALSEATNAEAMQSYGQAAAQIISNHVAASIGQVPLAKTLTMAKDVSGGGVEVLDPKGGK